MSTNPPTSSIFDDALADFKNGLTEKEKKDFSHTSIEDVMKAAEAIQKEQGQRGLLRNMNRIQPYINGLRQFSRVIEVFIQAKPEIMALIWGPTKFLLQVTSTYTDSFDKLLKALENVGKNLPRVEIYAELFRGNPRMHEVLVMVYKDILGFHRSTLKFFRFNAWKQLFRSLWHTFEDEFGNILSNLDSHRILLDKEAMAAHMAASSKTRIAADEARLAADEARAAILRVEREALRAEGERQKEREGRQIRHLKEWLDPVDYEAYRTKLGQPCQETGAWFIQEEGVRVWLDINDTTKRMLWLTGIPGSGKTILSSSMLQYLRPLLQNRGSVVFAFLRSENNTFTTIMRTLVFQLLLQTLPSHLLPWLHDMYESKPHCPPTSPEELEKTLEDMLGNIGITYLLIDGLDEIELKERKMVLSTLVSLLSKSANLKIFLSSRLETDISDGLRSITTNIHRVDIGANNSMDIVTYVSVAGKAVLNQFALDSDDTIRADIQKILNRVAHGAAGMFLWARLVIYNLLQQVDLEGLEEAGQNLPTGLDEAYGRILQRINDKLSPKERDLAQRVLGWVLCGKRPLRLEELKQALAIRVGERSINKRHKFLRRLEELCGPILETDVGGTVQFVHFTAKEYLITESAGKGPFISLAAAHRSVASTCIAYLSFTCFDSDLSDETIIENIKTGEYCLHEYAERNWLYHVKHATEKYDQSIDPLISLLENFVKIRRNAKIPHTFLRISSEDEFPTIAGRWPQVHEHLLDCHYYYSGKFDQKNIERCNPLTIQTSIQRFRENLENLFTPVTILSHSQLKHQYGINLFKCSQFNCPHYSEGFETREKREEHLQTHFRPLKCSVKACVFFSIGFASTEALSRHLRLYHPNLDSLADEFGLAEIGFEEHLDLTAMLFDAIATDDLASVKGAMTQGLDINATNDDGNTALHYALQVGSEDIVYLLLENGANPNGTNRDGDTSLHSATAKKSEALVELLLKSGAYVNQENTNGDTALTIAITEGVDDIVRLLLDNGAEMEKEIRHGPQSQAGKKTKLGHQSHTALEFALTQKSETVYLVLLSKTLRDGKQPVAGTLFPAIRQDWISTVRLLLQSGISPDSRGPTGPALVIAAEKGSEPMVRILLENGASVDILAVSGRTALIAAVNRGNVPIARLLLEKGANINKHKSKTSITPLLAAVKAKDEPMARLLLEHGADTSMISGLIKETALLAAVKAKDEPMIRLLLDYGADINKGSGYSRTTLLVAAVKAKDEPMVRLLLDCGADINMGSAYPGTMPLIAAVEAKDEPMVRLLLDCGADINKGSRTSGITPLVAAVEAKDEPMVRLLLDCGADINKGNSDTTPLIAAAKAKDEPMVRLLLDCGADINKGSRTSGTTPLVAAVKAKDEPMARLLLEHGADTSMISGLIKETALLAAVEAKDEPMIRLLLDYGADINKGSGLYSTTPLLAAVEAKDEPMVRLLLDCGADINMGSGYSGTTPLLAAVKAKDEPMARLLLDCGADINKESGYSGTTPLVTAVEAKDEPVIRLLLENGVDINLAAANGQTALMVAAETGDIPIVSLLLQNGAHIESMDGNSALVYAARNKTSGSEIIQLLLEKGADANGRNPQGMTALMIAAGTGMVEGVRMLLEGGADVNAKNLEGESALIYVPWGNSEDNLEVLSMLLGKGAEIDDAGLSGRTALTSAVNCEKKEIVQALLARGASVNLPGMGGETALVKAVKKGSTELVEILLEKGAYVSLMDNDGNIALAMASHPAVKQLLEKHISSEGLGLDIM